MLGVHRKVCPRFKNEIEMQGQSNIDKLRAWTLSAVNRSDIKSESCTPASKSEFWMVYDAVMAAAKFLKDRNIKAIIPESSNVLRTGISIQCGEASFHVAPPPAPGKKGVTDTSRAAYAQLNHSDQAREVATVVISLMNTTSFVSDNQVAGFMQIPAARVSARRNEIEEAGAIMVNGLIYQFKQAEKKIKCPVTGNTVNGWALERSTERKNQ